MIDISTASAAHPVPLSDTTALSSPPPKLKSEQAITNVIENNRNNHFFDIYSSSQF
jgi:hypothetical protein